MAHPLRWYLPGVVYELTTRTIQERFLLRPSREARELINGVIARAQLLYPAVALYAYVYLSNHFHMLASSTDGSQLAMFIGYINSNVAREMGRLHRWKGPFWARRVRPIPILDNVALVARLRYLLSNGVKEGLVASPRQWPGASSVPGLIGDMTVPGVWVDRDELRRARTKDPHADIGAFSTPLEVILSPLPVWKDLPSDALRAKHEALIFDVEREALTSSTPVLGIRRLLALDPHGQPTDPEYSRAPSCHTSSPQLRAAFKAAYRAFVHGFRVANRLASSAIMNVFPIGSFPRPPWYRQSEGQRAFADQLADCLQWTDSGGPLLQVPT